MSNDTNQVPNELFDTTCAFLGTYSNKGGSNGNKMFAYGGTNNISLKLFQYGPALYS